MLLEFNPIWGNKEEKNNFFFTALAQNSSIFEQRMGLRQKWVFFNCLMCIPERWTGEISENLVYRFKVWNKRKLCCEQSFEREDKKLGLHIKMKSKLRKVHKSMSWCMYFGVFLIFLLVYPLANINSSLRILLSW